MPGTEPESRPPVLYKFRGHSNVRKDIKNLLVKRKLWMASLDSLNDPFEGSMSATPLDPSTQPRLLAWLKATLGEGRDPVAFEAALIDPEAYPDFHGALRENVQRNVLGRFGICSLSANPVHPVMWALYSGGGRGFAVGYRTALLEMPSCDLRPVRYLEHVPPLWPPEDMSLPSLFFSKTEQWQFEEEWRLIANCFDGTRLHTAPQGAIEQVICGPRMTPESRNRLIEAAAALPDRPVLLFARRNSDSYEISLEESPEPA